jgi:hypothetical protein
MKKYRVKHLVLCEVSTWRVVEAKNYAEALAKVAEIETVTSAGECDYEIVSDREVIAMSIKEE